MYQIIGIYKDKEPEVIDTAYSRDDAWYLLTEYQMSFGDEWEMRIKKTY